MKETESTAEYVSLRLRISAVSELSRWVDTRTAGGAASVLRADASRLVIAVRIRSTAFAGLISIAVTCQGSFAGTFPAITLDRTPTWDDIATRGRLRTTNRRSVRADAVLASLTVGAGDLATTTMFRITRNVHARASAVLETLLPTMRFSSKGSRC